MAVIGNRNQTIITNPIGPPHINVKLPQHSTKRKKNSLGYIEKELSGSKASTVHGGHEGFVARRRVVICSNMNHYKEPFSFIIVSSPLQTRLSLSLTNDSGDGFSVRYIEVDLQGARVGIGPP
ncbi:hypothetical protein PIB30_033747 [Stylosanthes scabra]|uniref:Uncharacterized protein n=1 Tax=Stylosanthes scabra TaxID=79078 RepID=A0ABU6RCQ9_9FABA|nr:hypothetical protein [Stylosanthes scabra]